MAQSRKDQLDLTVVRIASQKARRTIRVHEWRFVRTNDVGFRMNNPIQKVQVLDWVKAIGS